MLSYGFNAALHSDGHKHGLHYRLHHGLEPAALPALPAGVFSTCLTSGSFPAGPALRGREQSRQRHKRHQQGHGQWQAEYAGQLMFWGK